MSTPELSPTAANEPKADTFSVNDYQVSLANKPRRLNWTVPSPPLAMFRLTFARLLWQKSCQVRCIADAQFFDVSWTVRVHRVRADLLCCGNVRARYDNRTTKATLPSVSWDVERVS